MRRGIIERLHFIYLVFICVGFTCTGKSSLGKCLCGETKNLWKAGIFGRYLAGWVPCRHVVNAPKQGHFSRRQGRCARIAWSGFAYNFLLESKTYILARWAFHLCEPCDMSIHFSQGDQNCTFIWAVRGRIRLADLPPKLPPKGFGTGRHRVALFCTHGTKSVLSLGTQYHQTQQNSIVTHKF